MNQPDHSDRAFRERDPATERYQTQCVQHFPSGSHRTGRTVCRSRSPMTDRAVHAVIRMGWTQVTAATVAGCPRMRRRRDGQSLTMARRATVTDRAAGLAESLVAAQAVPRVASSPGRVVAQGHRLLVAANAETLHVTGGAAVAIDGHLQAMPPDPEELRVVLGLLLSMAAVAVGLRMTERAVLLVTVRRSDDRELPVDPLPAGALVRGRQGVTSQGVMTETAFGGQTLLAVTARAALR